MTSYSKNTVNGTTYLPENVAIREALELNKTKIQLLQNTTIENNAMLSTGRVSGSDQNYYLKVTHTVVYLGDARYMFYTDSTYLSMPAWRDGDSIGSCAMGCTVTPDSQYGYYTYTTNYLFNGLTTSTENEFKSITRFENAINGNWYGSAGILYLPADVHDQCGNSMVITDFKAHFQYEGHVHDYESSKWINSIGCHEHTTVGFVINPGINIETSGSTASIGLSVVVLNDVVSADVEFNYIPD